MVILIIFYIIGCILSFGRLIAFVSNNDKKYIKNSPPETFDLLSILTGLLIVLLSWITFICGVFIYLSDDKWDKPYFLKYHRLDLWEEYIENNK